MRLHIPSASASVTAYIMGVYTHSGFESRISFPCSKIGWLAPPLCILHGASEGVWVYTADRKLLTLMFKTRTMLAQSMLSKQISYCILTIKPYNIRDNITSTFNVFVSIFIVVKIFCTRQLLSRHLSYRTSVKLVNVGIRPLSETAKPLAASQMTDRFMWIRLFNLIVNSICAP